MTNNKAVGKPKIIFEGNNDARYASLTCPKCGIVASIDRDQYEGRVSILCDCGWHETIDFREVV